MNRTIVFASLIAVSTQLSGCSWYWETSKKIGSYMPTYEGWFGDEKKADEQQLMQQSSPPPVSQSFYAPYNGGQAPVPPSQQRYMPIPGNAVQTPAPYAAPYGQYNTPPQQGYAPPSQGQGYPPFPPPGAMVPPPPYMPPAQAGEMPPPPPGFPPPAPQNHGGPDPMEGLKRLQMQQQQPQPDAYNSAPPAMPFTEPVLENEVRVDDMSATITEETSSNGRGSFSFLEDIGDVVSGWFSTPSTKEEKAFPNLASVPESQVYKEKMEENVSMAKELEADKVYAEKQHAAQDWSDLVEKEDAPKPVTSLSSITSPTGDEVVVAPGNIVEEPDVQPQEMPETVVVMPEKIEASTAEESKTETEIKEITAEPKPVVVEAAPIQLEDIKILETRPEYLRKPKIDAGNIQLLPRNRYAKRN